MIKFHLDCPIKKVQTTITHACNLLLIGSCFTESIGEKLQQKKFSILQNPAGILFNPISVANTINACVQQKKYTTEDLFYYNSLWQSWQHHSIFSGTDKTRVLDTINTSVHNAHLFLHNADYIFITLGSAWVYATTTEAQGAPVATIVANNHKTPSDWFAKKLLNTNETIDVLQTMLLNLWQLNAAATIIFTISPVRHLREGLVANNRSKATLIQAVHHLVEQYPQTYYFPAYELVIDDLRDYRFYAEDLVHPNYAATQYVWEKFVTAYMDEKTQLLLKEIEDITLAYQHKTLHPDSQQHQLFLKTYLHKTEKLQAQYQHLDFENEVHYFKSGQHK